MSAKSSMLLLGIGTSGAKIARTVRASYGSDIRLALADTDAMTMQNGDGENFILLGGDRPSGRGSGGDLVAGRMATEDSIHKLDAHLEGIRLTVIVTSLGGGTGGGATLETVKHLSSLGIPTIVFATLPFRFESEERIRNARGIMSLIEDATNATFFMPLDKLVGDTDNMVAAMAKASEVLASGITLFWRLIERPGFLRLDADRIRHFIHGAGRGRFASITCEGPSRASDAVDRLIRSELLATANAPVRTALCGVLAGDDLRLSELETISSGIQQAFGEHITFEISTVNDEDNFSGRLSVVVMLFESNGHEDSAAKKPNRPNPLSVSGSGQGFGHTERSEWRGEDLDIPTYLRKGITLEY